MSAWVIVIVGVVVWIIGQKIRSPGDSGGWRYDRVISIIGLCITVFGSYAGMKGPVTIGTTTFRTFSFAHAMQEASAESLSYARANLQVSSRPAPVWRGTSKSDLQCVVVNSGNKALQSVTFRFATTDHRTVDLRIRGPYPPKSTKKVFVALPDNVLKSYFAAPGMNVSNICGAHF